MTVRLPLLCLETLTGLKEECNELESEGCALHLCLPTVSLLHRYYLMVSTVSFQIEYWITLMLIMKGKKNAWPQQWFNSKYNDKKKVKLQKEGEV